MLMLYLSAVLFTVIFFYLGYGKYRVKFKENFSNEKHVFYVRAWSSSSAIMKVGSTSGYTPIVERVWLPRFLK